MTPLTPTESDLIARLKAGDPDAYETLFCTHAGAMMVVARRFFGDTDEAADAVQEAFVSAFRAMGSFAGTARLGTWLHRITTNACLMKLRSRKRRHDVQLDDTALVASQPDENELTRAETIARVRAGIDQLPRAYREVVLLRDIEGLGTAETADRLGTNEAVVKTRLHRARHVLKSILEPDVTSLLN